jgi:hypothetical protein
LPSRRDVRGWAKVPLAGGYLNANEVGFSSKKPQKKVNA